MMTTCNSSGTNRLLGRARDQDRQALEELFARCRDRLRGPGPAPLRGAQQSRGRAGPGYRSRYGQPPFHARTQTTQGYPGQYSWLFRQAELSPGPHWKVSAMSAPESQPVTVARLA